jgi:signal transduction histidine kinase
VKAPINQEAQAALQEREKANILVVDDLQEKHVVFRTILDELGENIVSARSGKEALRYILEKEFAVILLDVNMPDIDGLETASLIRHYKKSAQTPIVFITAYVDELQAKRGYALGAVDYIPSPVVPEVLRSKVRVFVELYRMNRQLQLRAAEREALARSEAARAAAEEAIQRADYLSEVSQQLSRSLDIEHTTRALLDLSVPMLGERAVLVIADGDGSILQSQASSAEGLESLPAPAREAVARVLKERRFSLWQDGAAVAAICPIATGERVRGALVLLGRREQFDSARVALAKEVASRASIAMENARLYSAVQEADRRKNEFLAMLAHELRNPLAPIRNAVHIMQGTDVAAPTLHWARDVISRQADHMARLIDDLLDVSRIVQGKVVVKPESLSLASLVEHSAEASMPKIEARGQQLVVDLPDEPVVVDGDSVRLAQVLSNLINNASKFSPASSRILLRGAWCDGVVRIGIKDEGSGIDPAFLPHVFDLFAQADQSLDRSQGGLGIGLTLVKHLVELHGGASGRPRRSAGPHRRGASRRCAGGRCTLAHPGGRRPDGVGRDPDDAAGDGRVRGQGRQRRHGRAAHRRGLPARRGAAGHRAARHERLRGGAPVAQPAGLARRAAHCVDGLWRGRKPHPLDRGRVRLPHGQAGRREPAVVDDRQPPASPSRQGRLRGGAATIAASQERWMSGLSRTPGKRVRVNSPPRVRIPPSPPAQLSP